MQLHYSSASFTGGKQRNQIACSQRKKAQRVKKRGTEGTSHLPGNPAKGGGGIPTVVGGWHIRVTGGKSPAWNRLSSTRCHPCATARSSWETFRHVLWGEGPSGSLNCSQNRTPDISPGSAVLGGCFLLANECIACEIEAMTNFNA